MSTGTETLHQIIDAETEYVTEHGESPRVLKLPVLMAIELAKCDHDDLGDLTDRISRDGITVLENEGFHGMRVEIVRHREAVLEFE